MLSTVWLEIRAGGVGSAARERPGSFKDELVRGGGRELTLEELTLVLVVVVCLASLMFIISALYFELVVGFGPVAIRTCSALGPPTGRAERS